MPNAMPMPLRSGLAALQDAAASSPESRARFENALRAANEAGWSYRQLAEALGVSHFYISARIKHAAASTGDFGFDIPARSRPTTRIVPRKMPETMRADLEARLREASSGSSVSPVQSGLSPAVADFFQSLQAAVDAGWDPAEIGPPLGMSPRAVARFTTYHGDEARTPRPDYPAPAARTAPAAWNARYPAVPPVKIPDADINRLRELAGPAHLNRGVGENDAGTQGAAIEYTSLIANWYLRGASRQELERATGQGWEAVRKRLSRWGFMSPPKTP